MARRGWFAGSSAHDPIGTTISLPQPDSRIPVYLDCDTGVDDALAILYLLARPEVDLVGVGGVFGNTSVTQGAANTLALLELAGRTDVPVAVGADAPLDRPFDGGAPHVHGANGIGDVVLPTASRPLEEGTAADLLVRLAHEHAGRLHVIAVGPMTNLALALRQDPSIVEHVADVTIMGGSALAPGNITPLAEANVYHDAVAARELFEAPWAVTVVGLDVTMDNFFEEPHRQALLASASPAARAAGEMLGVYFRFYEQVTGRLCSALHDPLAAAIAVGGTRVETAPVVKIEVDATDGPGHGQTVCDMRAKHRGYPPARGARHRVVLSVEEGFPDALLDAIR